MRDLEFFAGVPQHPVTLAGYEFPSPTFYYDYSQASVVAVTPLERIKELLPSPRLYPLRLTPRSGVTVIVAYEYRDSDIGPYNEVAVGFPVTVDRNAPVVTELRRFQVQGGSVFIWQLPVTTAIARDLGVEVAGYPKFLADIVFTRDKETTTCTLSENRQPILSLRGKNTKTARGKLTKYKLYTCKDGIPLCANLHINPLEYSQARGRNLATLDLGTGHRVCTELREMTLSRRPVLYQYMPSYEAILFGSKNIIDD